VHKSLDGHTVRSTIFYNSRFPRYCVISLTTGQNPHMCGDVATGKHVRMAHQSLLLTLVPHMPQAKEVSNELVETTTNDVQDGRTEHKCAEAVRLCWVWQSRCDATSVLSLVESRGQRS